MPPMPTPTDEPFTPPTMSAAVKEDAPPFRWRKGELIGCGGFGRALRELELILMATLAVQFTRLTRRFSRPSPTHVSRSFQLILKRHRPTFRLKLLRNRCVLVGNSRRPFTVAASSSSEWNKNVGTTEERYDIIVVGGGHAGCEAALAFARIGAKTLLLTLNLDRIAWQPCNPAVGGPGKSQLVHEVDALGGEIGKVADSELVHKTEPDHEKPCLIGRDSVEK